MGERTPETLCTIVIPAFNEEAVIGTTLRSLLEGARSAEFDVIVVCNGCEDGTAEMARQAAPDVRVISVSEASKTRALNVGINAAANRPVVFLDADIKTSANSVRMLVQCLNTRDVALAYGSANFNTTQSSVAVRAFYEAWRQNPYFDKGKVGGFFALSQPALDDIGHFPATTNDDEFIRRRFSERSQFVPSAPYQVDAPRTLRSLIGVRSRVYRGNKQLLQDGVADALASNKLSNIKFLFRLISNPTLWPGAVMFGVISLAAHSRNFFIGRSNRWERDNTARIGWKA